MTLAEENPLLTLPRPVIDALFQRADEEARIAKERILRLKAKLDGLRRAFNFHRISSEKSGRVAVTDGSMSVGPSERLGSSFAIYTAGYMVFDDGRLIDEEYYAGSLSWSHWGTAGFRTLLKLLMAYAERMSALEALKEHDPDVVLLDGPFFFFRGHCRHVRSVRLGVPNMEMGIDLIRLVRDATLELIRSGRAVGIARRSVIRAIDGWLIYTQGKDACLGTSDKHIMTVLMPPMSVWSYREALDYEPLIYSTFYGLYMKYMQMGEPPDKLNQRKDDLISQSEESLEDKFEKDLDVSLKEIPKSNRYYVRYSQAASPFEVEAPDGFDVIGFAGRFADFFNVATGLPMPLDLIDGAVTLQRGATTAFTEEIEARLLREPDIEDKTVISQYFTSLNPQKKEYV